MRVAAFLLSLALSTVAVGQEPASRPEQHPVLGTVVVVGASLTDGFGNGVPLSGLLEKSISVPHKRVGRLSSFMFFNQPLPTGKQQMVRALRAKPTLVVGPDFLFWYAYGFLGKIRASAQKADPDADVGDELEAREWLLARGFEQLERLSCRVVVGDLPDMRGADERMLSPRQIPSREVLAKLNERIRAWARKREQVHVLPMAKWVRDMKSGRMELLRDREVVKLPPEKLLMKDRLHPSRLGALVFHSRLVGELHRWLGKRVRGALEFDVWKELAEKGLDKELRGEKKN